MFKLVCAAAIVLNTAMFVFNIIMQHNDWAVGRYRIQVCQTHPTILEKYRVKAPCNERRDFVGASGLYFVQPFSYGLNGFEARPDCAIRPFAVVISNISVIPEQSFHHMTVAFDKTWQNDFIGKYGVDWSIRPFYLP